ERTGDEDERHIRFEFVQDAQRIKAGELRQTEVRQNEVGRKLNERTAKVCFGVHPQGRELDAGLAQLALGQLRVRRNIFQKEDSRSFVHDVLWVICQR